MQKFAIVLYTNMAVSSREWKPREISYIRAVITGSVYYINTNELPPVQFSPFLSLLSEPHEDILEQFWSRTWSEQQAY